MAVIVDEIVSRINFINYFAEKILAKQHAHELKDQGYMALRLKYQQQAEEKEKRERERKRTPAQRKRDEMKEISNEKAKRKYAHISSPEWEESWSKKSK